jgi:uncharacterized protein
MKKIGLLSDTHSFLDPKVFEHFADVDEIWHAGDIGSQQIIDDLNSFKNTKFVYGNIDSKEIQNNLPEDLIFTVEGINVYITHIGGLPPKFTKRTKEIIKNNDINLFICGHSHILRAIKAEEQKNLLYLNPGACGHEGFHQMRTLVKFEIAEGKMRNLLVIELGKRGFKNH